MEKYATIVNSGKNEKVALYVTPTLESKEKGIGGLLPFILRGATSLPHFQLFCFHQIHMGPGYPIKAMISSTYCLLHSLSKGKDQYLMT
jgi:hypothetical protein